MVGLQAVSVKESKDQSRGSHPHYNGKATRDYYTIEAAPNSLAMQLVLFIRYVPFFPASNTFISIVVVLMFLEKYFTKESL
ncbi:hypothetical protein D8M05_16985 [Oceanobacillus bengalensis]|uniref:Uncharacterized protein n=1 Tax=Oceanobacillus bengalensis TaxID=1435466 RepID=A0A494YST4_9BACI|nr:hypothetical protein D8M05_16985 [Oceanobacillus bengalensis]